MKSSFPHCGPREAKEDPVLQPVFGSNEVALRDPWDYNKRSSIHMTGVLGGEEKEGRAEST